MCCTWMPPLILFVCTVAREAEGASMDACWQCDEELDVPPVNTCFDGFVVSIGNIPE